MNKKNYMSPMVEILNARVEKGFQISGGSESPHIHTGLHDEVPGSAPANDITGMFD